MQDVYIIVGKNLDKVDESDEIKTRNYLITISRNYCISRWRKTKKHQTEPYFDDKMTEQKEHDPAETIVYKEEVIYIKKALEKLDPKYRSAIVLKYFNNFSDDTIASILNIKKKNVQMRIYRAKILIRTYVKEFEDGQS